ncbi:winged helix-turn-helix transcriptional regulator [Ralstonia pseudosolanacearum]|uniref:winged helix-turn-helix transcriptional regulator n=1 Tax=Ralstonia pseudosolanacearum TaxID=1310165 RepID=UPI0018A4F8BD|nr:helix-turn-helix domain-containing protein [Ralstonia pseudosolanacearum]BCL94368.1 transcriptional regulator [Ralstonia solanacearum]BCL99513.1 transcriptional regulator [Ralstonia solanacearum]BCM14990.1 transcriptional regulator [Ralstonia solanacearum]BCN06934.1 transcriptional regulator [Ralstonia solanacearum]BCN12094.1 transcriptional regulator [Ralstonia solanacearum]
MGWSEVGETVCPIARTLAVVGDRWTVLILRELFLGVKRFEEFQAQTGMSSHLLSTRLKRLEADGIVVRHLYSDRPPRHEYRLTSKGLDFYPLLLSLKSWGEKWGGFKAKTAPALTITHRQCGHETGLKLVCPACDEPFGPKDATVTLGASFKAERQARRDGT